MYIICLKLLVHTENIDMEGTMSQIFYTGPHSFIMKCRKNIQKNNKKVTRVLTLNKNLDENKKSETQFPQHGYWLLVYQVLNFQSHY